MVAERLSSALGLSEDDGSSEVSKIQLSILAPRLEQREQQVRTRHPRAQPFHLLDCAEDLEALFFTSVLLHTVCAGAQGRPAHLRV